LFLGTTAVWVQNGAISLQGCQIVGANSLAGPGSPNAGLVATNATVTAIDSSFRGGSATNPQHGPYPGYGLYLDNSDLYASRLTARGGDGSGYYYQPLPAVKAVGSSRVLVSDSIFYGGAQISSGLPTACPVAATLGRLTRCVLVPFCPPAIPINGPLLGLHRPAPMASPGAVALEFRTAANQPVGVYLSTGLGQTSLPLLEQPILLDLANVQPFALLVADATGLAVVSCSIPAGFAGLEFWFQGVSGPSLPLQLSAVGGGIVR
jgi:hypothetical protein